MKTSRKLLVAGALGLVLAGFVAPGLEAPPEKDAPGYANYRGPSRTPTSVTVTQLGRLDGNGPSVPPELRDARMSSGQTSNRPGSLPIGGSQ